MEFSVKQINNLLTGVILAAELESDTPELRKFLVMQSWQIDENGKRKLWDKKVKSPDKIDNVMFTVRYYSIKAEKMELYTEHGYEIDRRELTKDVLTDGITGWENLYKTLSQYTDDLSILRPQWYCDNPLEPLE